ncbi:MAG: protein translocase subunit SecD [Acidobacteriota bacterium]|jgi:preprotein translocase subunit SecD|nr:protein translocase subunit SecD [Acidobacteriota bacterium]
MKNSNLWIRTAIIIAIVVLGIYLVIGPRGSITAKDFTLQGIQNNLAKNINLGLDLRGGSHLVMRVKTELYLQKLTRENKDAAVNAAKAANLPVEEGTFTAQDNTYRFTLNMTDAAKASEISKVIKEKIDLVNWNESVSGNTITWELPSLAQATLREQATEQALQIIESRIDDLGLKEPTIQRRGTSDSGEILLQMPGVEDPQRVKDILKADSNLSLMAVVSQPNPNLTTYPTEEAALQTIGGKPNSTRKVYEYVERDDTTNDAQPQENQPKRWIMVEYPPIIEGSEMRDAQGVSQSGNQGDYQISFQLKPEGAKKFGAWTGANIGNYMAVILGNETKKVAKSVAFIQGQIYDQGQISGRFTQQNAEDLALTLRSGSLPTEIEYLEERTVGPSLGADSIQAGLTAALGGLIFIIVFMLFYYRGSGINAVIALSLNMLLTIAALVVLNATLTLPGMAGLILGIGMAVDANVLVFERTREELKAGKSVAKSIDIGFERAFITIIDSNVTTIIAGIILYMFGSGPIRGFAVTLILGLLINLFTAIFVSRTIFMWLLERNPNKTKLSI